MFKGIQMTLMIGPAVPVPVPQSVLDALTGVTVNTSTSGPSGFELNFDLSNQSPLHTMFLISGGSTPIPIIRVVIVATLNGTPEVLMDGVMTEHSVSPGSGPGKSTLTVRGVDLTAVLDWIDFSGIPYPAMPPEARVALILVKYSFLGIIPMVIPSILIDVPIPTDRIPAQSGTDLSYIQALADEVGYVFYIEPGPRPGSSIAYWGPEIKVGTPQPALNSDMGPHTNIESIQFAFDSEKKELPIILIYNQETHAPIPIPVPDITPLNPPLGLIPTMPKKYNWIDETARKSPVQAALIGLARAAKSAEVVTANGSLDVLRYGRVLKARRLVGVRGVGPAFDGLYYVQSVSHQIKRNEYKQNFSLSRNGLLSTFPQVPA